MTILCWDSNKFSKQHFDILSNINKKQQELIDEKTNILKCIESLKDKQIIEASHLRLGHISTELSALVAQEGVVLEINNGRSRYWDYAFGIGVGISCVIILEVLFLAVVVAEGDVASTATDVSTV